MNEDVAPLVRVVVVNYNGGALTRRCLESLEAGRWPRDRLELVLVDNASTDGIAAEVARDLPAVRVIQSDRNRGFAGGCNLGMADLDAVDFVGLVNNDATVDRDWLAPLVEALRHDATLGAVCPKILFSDVWADIEVASPTRRHGRGDRRDLGVKIEGARVGGHNVWSRVQRVDGFWGDDPLGEWTSAVAHLRVPAPDTGDATAELLMSADDTVTATLRSGTAQSTASVGADASWHPIVLRTPRLEIVNNTGSELIPYGFGRDRDYLVQNDASHDTPDDVFAWCGAGVLLRRAYLDDVGTFDERLFLYYEDFELSWRGRDRGWRYRYVPSSVVRHVHAATAGEGSPVKAYYTERNRLLVLTRHGSAREARRAVGRFVLVTASYARRDIVSPILRGRRPHSRIVTQRLHAFGAYVRRSMGMIVSKRRDRRRNRAHPRPAPS